jgi:hypothetical protein
MTVLLLMLSLLAWQQSVQGTIETGLYSYKSLVRFHETVTTKLECQVRHGAYQEQVQPYD